MFQVQVEASEFVHVRVFRPLPHTGADPQLSAFELGKTETDAIGYFEKWFMFYIHVSAYQSKINQGKG